MPPTLDFAPTGPDDDGPDLAAHECPCKPADDQYLLTVEEGQVSIVHAACGKQPPSTCGDWHDLAVMDNPIPVTVTWVNDTGTHWEDPDPYVQITATSVPEDVRAAALELSRKHQQAAEEQAELTKTAGKFLLVSHHTPAGYNAYGSVITPGYRVDQGPDGTVRVDHRMPEADLSDPDRPSSDDRAAERHRQVNAYAATFTAAGWTVERYGPHDQRPWLLARPADQDGGETS
jgi:hypothetical protein